MAALLAPICSAAAPDETAVGAAADSPAFDMGALSARGIDAGAARYFQRAARFMPGVTSIQLQVNGRRKGRADARFDANGQLCATPDLLRAAGLAIPAGLRDDASPASPPSASECVDYPRAYPAALITLHPDTGTVAFIVPPEALDTPPRRAVDFTTGGMAGLVNYDALSMVTRGPAGTAQYWQAATELGFNADSWIVRSRQITTSQGGETRFDHQSAYAQRTFASRETVLQAGQINPRSTLFAIGPLYGLQLFPDDALAAPPESGAIVTGIARTQARIEVRQLGVLIHVSELPPGPFTLRDLPLVSGNADLDVTIVEATGAPQRFVVPAAALGPSRLGTAPGLALAVGRLQNQNDMRAPWLATASRGWRVGTRVNLNAGVLMSAPYQALAAGVEGVPLTGIQAAAQVAFTRATDGSNGAQGSLSVGSQWMSDLNFNVSASQRSAGYRELGDALQQPGAFAPSARAQYTAGAAWRHATLGNVAFNYTRAMVFDGSGTQRVTASWTRSFGPTSVSLNLSRSIGNGTSGGEQAYLSVNVPLGRRSISTYANVSGADARFGVRYADRVGRYSHYSIASDYDSDRRRASMRAALSMTPRRAQLGLTASTYGAAGSTLTANLRGGVVVDGAGPLLSPYEIRDTFGVARVADQPGIELSTPAGPVWTNPAGRAAIASLPAYTSSHIVVATKSLPRNVDLANGLQSVDPGRGSVSRLEFSVQRARRILLAVKLNGGEPLPKLASIVDEDGRFVTVSADGGRVMLSGRQWAVPLRAELPDGTVCRVTYALPDAQPQQVRYYERIDARCVL